MGPGVWSLFGGVPGWLPLFREVPKVGCVCEQVAGFAVLGAAHALECLPALDGDSKLHGLSLC